MKLFKKISRYGLIAMTGSLLVVSESSLLAQNNNSGTDSRTRSNTSITDTTRSEWGTDRSGTTGTSGRTSTSGSDNRSEDNSMTGSNRDNDNSMTGGSQNTKNYKKVADEMAGKLKSRINLTETQTVRVSTILVDFQKDLFSSGMSHSGTATGDDNMTGGTTGTSGIGTDRTGTSGTTGTGTGTSGTSGVGSDRTGTSTGTSGTGRSGTGTSDTSTSTSTMGTDDDDDGTSDRTGMTGSGAANTGTAGTTGSETGTDVTGTTGSETGTDVTGTTGTEGTTTSGHSNSHGVGSSSTMTGTGSTEMMRNFQEARRSADEDIMDVLDSNQKTQYNRVKDSWWDDVRDRVMV